MVAAHGRGQDLGAQGIGRASAEATIAHRCGGGGGGGGGGRLSRGEEKGYPEREKHVCREREREMEMEREERERRGREKIGYSLDG